MEVSGQIYSPAVVPLGINPRYPDDRRLFPRIRLDMVSKTENLFFDRK
jgi:hypothetical protein